MKILFIVQSKHRQNTLQVAEAIAEAAPVTICELENAAAYNLDEYDIIGFGSGVYAGSFDKKLIKFVQSLDDKQRYCFVFSTSGTGNYQKYNEKFIKLVESKNMKVLGSFGTKGLCKWFIFALVGGIAKGHPDGDDFSAAQDFIVKVMEEYEKVKG